MVTNLVRIVDVYAASTLMYAILHRSPIVLWKGWTLDERADYARMYAPDLYLEIMTFTNVFVF